MDKTVCKKNPAAGVSSIPLSTLQGSPAPAPTASVPDVPLATTKAGGLPTGEWACYGVGDRVLLSFHLQPDGSYLDADRKKAGTYRHNAADASVTFRGGPMEGQTGKNVRGRNFELTRTVQREATL